MQMKRERERILLFCGLALSWGWFLGLLTLVMNFNIDVSLYTNSHISHLYCFYSSATNPLVVTNGDESETKNKTKKQNLQTNRSWALVCEWETLWIVCAEPKYDSPVGEPLLLTTRVEARRRSRPLHDESGRWVCDVCGKTYNRGDSLAHHRSIHRGDTICPICQAVFTRKYTMRCHMVNVHGVK